MSRLTKTTETSPRTLSTMTPWWPTDMDRMESMFGGLWPRQIPVLFDWNFMRPSPIATPAIDVYQEGDDVVVKAEIPGVRKEDLEITVSDSTLSIHGEKAREAEGGDERYYRCERSYGSISRSVELPCEVQADKARATFSDGVLEVRLPASETSRDKAVKLKIG